MPSKNGHLQIGYLWIKVAEENVIHKIELRVKVPQKRQWIKMTQEPDNSV
jgi:hypothetical protein